MRKLGDNDSQFSNFSSLSFIPTRVVRLLYISFVFAVASNIIFHPNREIRRLKINVQVRSLRVKFYKSACKKTFEDDITTFEYILNINYLIIMNSANEILVKKIAAIINNNQLTLISPFDRLQFIHFNSILFLKQI